VFVWTDGRLQLTARTAGDSSTLPVQLRREGPTAELCPAAWNDEGRIYYKRLKLMNDLYNNQSCEAVKRETRDRIIWKKQPNNEQKNKWRNKYERYYGPGRRPLAYLLYYNAYRKLRLCINIHQYAPLRSVLHQAGRECNSCKSWSLYARWAACDALASCYSCCVHSRGLW